MNKKLICLAWLLNPLLIVAQSPNLPAINIDSHTLQVYPTDNSSGLPWGPDGVAVGATSIIDGNGNTLSIINEYGNWNQGNYAANICAQLDAFGYSDWYLPSATELAHIWGKRDEIGGFSTMASYWTSTEEYWGTEAAAIDFSSGIILERYKDELHRVRCVREVVSPGATSDIPPILLTHDYLPFELEGYTIVITEDGPMLYNDYFDLPAQNVYYSGGVKVEINLIRSIPYLTDKWVGSNEKIKVDTPYELLIKVSSGGWFDGGNKMTDDIHGPGSQVIVHLPGSADITGWPVIEVDGRTVSQELVHSLWSVVGFGIPAAGSVGTVITNMIINSIAGLLGDRLIDDAYRRFRPSERIEVDSEMNFPKHQRHHQLTWQLGGWNLRDYREIETAEIIIPITFKEEGNVDISCFFNIWGTHTDASRGGTPRVSFGNIFHSFRQHIVIDVEVDQGQAAVSEDERRGTFTDPRDGQTYRWVRIGDQVWMAENLNYASAGSWCYNDNASKCDHYGRLYTWAVVMNGASSSSANPSGVQGICPPGWHVPSDAEWIELVNYVVSQGYPNEWHNPNGAGNALKSCRQVGSPLRGECNTSEHPRWNSHETHHGFDQFGFSALPGGFRWSNGSFGRLGTFGAWWSSTEYSSTNAWRRRMYHYYGNVHRYYVNKTAGFSLRCVRDL